MLVGAALRLGLCLLAGVGLFRGPTPDPPPAAGLAGPLTLLTNSPPVWRQASPSQGFRPGLLPMGGPALCPWTTKWANAAYKRPRRTTVYYPFNEETAPAPMDKRYDIVYAGGLPEPLKFILDVVPEFNYR